MSRDFNIMYLLLWRASTREGGGTNELKQKKLVVVSESKLGARIHGSEVGATDLGSEVGTKICGSEVPAMSVPPRMRCCAWPSTSKPRFVAPRCVISEP